MTTTPLAQHREANADARKLAAIRERIAAAGVEYIYYQGVTIIGRVIGDDAVVRSALGDEVSDLLVAYKTDEWARFCRHVTDWEFQMYSEAVPSWRAP